VLDDFGNDTIFDYVVADDSLTIRTTLDQAEMEAAATQDGADVVIDLGGGDSITILNATEADIEGDWNLVGT